MIHEKLHLLLPWERIENGAQEQILTVCRFPFVEKVAIMPDVHQGYDMPIGGVARTDRVISPAWVGCDIGCGMSFADTGVTPEGLTAEHTRWKILEDIENAFPLGVGGSRPRGISCPEFIASDGDQQLTDEVNAKLRFQLGTLGGGNHFVEVGTLEKRGTVAVTVHSGSRKPGWLIARHHMRKTKKVDKDLPKGFFHSYSEAGHAYRDDMDFALDYALESRTIMLRAVLEVLATYKHFSVTAAMGGMINEHHNYADVDLGGQVTHRKGATPAELDQMGVIPICINAGVYVTRGLGNEEYLSSASHGAGRTLGRRDAKELLDMKDFADSVEGIACRVTEDRLDESPEAYKAVEDIIPAQDGVVVKVVDRTIPFVVGKG